jgi:hypothetical protein
MSAVTKIFSGNDHDPPPGPLEETTAVIAAMDSYDTLGFTVIDRF